MERDDPAQPDAARGAGPAATAAAPEPRPLSRAAASRRRRSKSRSRNRSAKLRDLLGNLGWLLLAAAVGVPLLAGALYMMGR